MPVELEEEVAGMDCTDILSVPVEGTQHYMADSIRLKLTVRARPACDMMRFADLSVSSILKKKEYKQILSRFPEQVFGDFGKSLAIILRSLTVAADQFRTHLRNQCMARILRERNEADWSCFL